MTDRRVSVAQSDELTAARLDELADLCAAAFNEPYPASWEHIGPGLHVLVDLDGRLVAHAMLVDRRLYVGTEPDVALDAAYVELVATRPGLQGSGHGTVAMREIGRIIDDDYVLGALATGSNPFYERLGWETWRGPTFIHMPDGERVRSANEDGHVMVLRTPRTPPSLDLAAPIAVEWRPVEPW